MRTVKQLGTRYICLVCGYPGLEHPPTDFNICPSCGVEFGYQTAGRSFESLRKEWIITGAHWASRVDPKPRNWNPWLQLIEAKHFLAIPVFARITEAPVNVGITINKEWRFAPVQTTHGERCVANMRLLAFLPCEKIIISNVGNPSLISVLSKVEITIPENETVPPEAVTPKEWYIFILWELWPEERGRQFDQKLQIYFPNGQPFGTAPSSIRFPLKPVPEQMQAMNQVNLNGLPVGQAGNLLLRMWVVDNGNPITEVFDYRIETVHHRVPASEFTPSTIIPS